MEIENINANFPFIIYCMSVDTSPIGSFIDNTEVNWTLLGPAEDTELWE